MNDHNDILKNTYYWLWLSERYFDAETTEEEEEALMRFVTSDYAEDASLDEQARSVFNEVKATMSLTHAYGHLHNQTNNRTTLAKEKTPKRGRTIWRWIAATAAVFAVAFFVKSIFFAERETDGDVEGKNICMARENGRIITDKSKVLSMMHDSWEDIDIQASCGEEVGAQLQELFDVLE